MVERTQPQLPEAFINALRRILPSNIDGEGLVLAHFFSIMWLISVLMMGNINFFYYLLFSIWLIITGTLIFFKICIVTEIERKLFNDTQWEGPMGLIVSTLLKLMGIQKKSGLVQSITELVAVLITLFIIVKIKNCK